MLKKRSEIRNQKSEEKELNNEESTINLPGLICLKGGDLAQEISESGLRPRMMAIDEIFKEECFKEKYLLYVSL